MPGREERKLGCQEGGKIVRVGKDFLGAGEGGDCQGGRKNCLDAKEGGNIVLAPREERLFGVWEEEGNRETQT